MQVLTKRKTLAIALACVLATAAFVFLTHETQTAAPNQPAYSGHHSTLASDRGFLSAQTPGAADTLANTDATTPSSNSAGASDSGVDSSDGATNQDSLDDEATSETLPPTSENTPGTNTQTPADNRGPPNASNPENSNPDHPQAGYASDSDGTNGSNDTSNNSGGSNGSSSDNNGDANNPNNPGTNPDDPAEDPIEEPIRVIASVDGFDKELPILYVNEDFVLGKPIGISPNQIADENGTPILTDLVESKERDGCTLIWRDQNGDEFDWMTTPINETMIVTGTFEVRPVQVRVVFNDDAQTPDLITNVDVGSSFADHENIPAEPTKKGYAFDGWIDDRTQEPFDFTAAVKVPTTVRATYKLVDSAEAPRVDPAKDLPNTITGTCYIGATWGVHPAQFSVSGFSGDLAGVSGTGTCSLPSAAAPSYTHAEYRATLSSVDTNTGTVVYDVTITPPGVASPDGPRNKFGLIGYQTVSLRAVIHKNFGGYVDVTKTSAAPSISDNTQTYSLEGAVFGLYDKNGNRVQEFRTDSQGNTNTSSLLPVGTYTLKEEQAPRGFSLAADKAVNVASGATTSVTVADMPQHTPPDSLIQKNDKETDSNHPLGSATLANTQFKVSYYDAYFDSIDQALASGTPHRQWIFKSDDQGKVTLDKDHLVSGDPFFTNAQGKPVLALGTYVFEEITAPTGYLRDHDKQLRTVKPEGTNELASHYDAPVFKNQVIRGDLSFIKIAAHTTTHLPNVPFTITSQTTGESHRVMTDENGMINTSAAWIEHTNNTNGGNRGDGVWFGQPAANANMTTEPQNHLGALPYDTYRIAEERCAENEGFSLVDFTVTITRHGTTLDMGTIENNPTPRIVVSKVDATTAEQVIGAELILEKLVKGTSADGSEDGSGPTETWEEVARTITTEEPWVIEATPGTYRLAEILAPPTYLTAEPIIFELYENAAVKEVVMKDEPIEITGDVDKKQTMLNPLDLSYRYTLDFRSTAPTYADEYTVIDDLTCARNNHAYLETLTTPVVQHDDDGLFSLWYLTNYSSVSPEDVTRTPEELEEIAKGGAGSEDKDEAESEGNTSGDVSNDANVNTEGNTKADSDEAPAEDNPAVDTDKPEDSLNKVRLTNLEGWNLWQAGLSTTEPTTLSVADLNLAEDEYITAFAFAYDRVNPGFGTLPLDDAQWFETDRYALDDFCTDEHAGITNDAENNTDGSDAGEPSEEPGTEEDNGKDNDDKAGDGATASEITPLEDEADSAPEVPSTPTTPTTPETPTAPVDYAPAILVMKAEPHVLMQTDPLPLQNHTFIEMFRNGGIDEKLRDYDSDQVEQVIEPDLPVTTFDDPEEPEEPEPDSSTPTPEPESDAKAPTSGTPKTGTALLIGLFALCAIALISGIVLFIMRRRKQAQLAENTFATRLGLSQSLSSATPTKRATYPSTPRKDSTPRQNKPHRRPHQAKRIIPW